MKILFVDTETTGLCEIRTPYNPETLESVWPNLTKISWTVDEVDPDTFMVASSEKYSFYLHPEYPELKYDSKAQEVTGITYSYLQDKGCPVSEIMTMFCQDLNSVDIVVAHNTTFDMKMIKAELLRLGRDQHMRVCPWLDTVWYSKSYVNIKDSKGRLKFPTLQELASKCGVDYGQLHDSDEDVRVMKQCFYRLIQEGVISPERINLRIKEHKSTANS